MEDFYTVNQAAIALKVHPLTIRRYIREGKLKAYRAGGNIRIAVNDLRNFAQSFMPHHIKQNIKQNKLQISAQIRNFSFSDPILTLKGKGLSMAKLEE